jgi:hypothetical protein
LVGSSGVCGSSSDLIAAASRCPVARAGGAAGVPRVVHVRKERRRAEAMRRAAFMLIVCLCVLAVGLSAGADYSIPQHVVGSGGGETSGPNHRLVGTVGQAAIGIVSGPSNIHEIGFWYQPGWILTDVEEGDALPTRYWLGQNQPNPFNPVTTIRFALPNPGHVTMKLYDVAGREVRTLVDEELPAGWHRTVLEASKLASGIYFCRMTAGEFVDARKLLLLK